MDIKTPLQEMVPEQIQDSGGNPEIISAIKEPFEKKPKLSVWKIVIPVVMLLVLLGGLVAYSLSPKAGLGVIPPSIVELESPSSVIPQNWLTYTNAKYEFSIDYPADWIKTDSPSGDGATFEPQKSNESPELSEDITLYVGQKTMTEETLTFEKYAKVAAIQEIQNYNSLASIEQLTLSDGTIGYKTTWMVQSLVDPQGAESESAPITYFEIPGMPTQLLRINSGYDTDPAVYDRMIKSVVFTKVSVSVPTDASPAPSLAPVVNEKVILAKTIKEQILLKSSGDNGSDPNSLTVTVSEVSGDYAKGMASDDGGGGMWFAAKVNGVWKLVWDGNGIITCDDLKDYPNFSKVMIPECYDVANDKSVKR